jgi:hypothetical protein
MKTRPVGTELFHEDRQMDGQTDRHDEANSCFKQFFEFADYARNCSFSPYKTLWNAGDKFVLYTYILDKTFEALKHSDKNGPSDVMQWTPLLKSKPAIKQTSDGSIHNPTAKPIALR